MPTDDIFIIEQIILQGLIQGVANQVEIYATHPPWFISGSVSVEPYICTSYFFANLTSHSFGWLPKLYLMGIVNKLTTGRWLWKRTSCHMSQKDTQLFLTLKCPIENVLEKSTGWSSLRILISENLVFWDSTGIIQIVENCAFMWQLQNCAAGWIWRGKINVS